MLDQQGIERPREEAYDEDVIEKMNEIRSRTQAKIAELEILHQKTLANSPPEEHETHRQELRAEIGRLEDKRDRDIERLRTGQS